MDPLGEGSAAQIFSGSFFVTLENATSRSCPFSDHVLSYSDFVNVAASSTKA